MNRLVQSFPIWFPFALSGAQMLLILGFVALRGGQVNGQISGESSARLFQLLLLVQIPFMAYVIASQKTPLKSAIAISAAQLLAAIGVFVLVYWVAM